jgi:hypothetical protein
MATAIARCWVLSTDVNTDTDGGCEPADFGAPVQPWEA